MTDQLVTIICANCECLQSTRNTLCTISPYFDRMFNGNFSESSGNIAKLPNVEAELLQRVLRFYYRVQNQTAKTSSNFCKIFMKCQEECLEIIELCDMLGCVEALSECDKYLMQTMHLSCIGDLCELSEMFHRYEVIKEAVKLHSTTCQGQEICAFCTSVKSQHENLETEITDQGIHHPKCNINSYVDLYDVSTHMLVIGGHQWQPLSECYSMRQCDLTLPNVPEDSKIKERLKTQKNICKFTRVADFPCSHLEEYRVVSSLSLVYVTGGFNTFTMKASDRTWCYDSETDQWKELSPMRNKRFYHCIFHMNKLVFVCGGYDDDKVVQSTECYRYDFNEWVEMATMPIGVGNAAHASYSGHLYVLCGQFGYADIQTTNAVQRYDVSSDQWTIVTNYSSPAFFPQSEYGLTCVIKDDKITVIGGQTIRVDQYDLKTGEWKRLCDMNCRRMESSVIIIDKKIIVAGGYDYEEGYHHDTIETYDDEANTWGLMTQQLPLSARSFGLCNVIKCELRK